jgi:hypothetical protein
MKKTALLRLICILLLSASSTLSFGQSFEGWIIFKIEARNPNPKMFPDSTWQKITKQQFGDRGYAIQKYYYKKDMYISQYETAKGKGFQATIQKTSCFTRGR